MLPAGDYNIRSLVSHPSQLGLMLFSAPSMLPPPSLAPLCPAVAPSAARPYHHLPVPPYDPLLPCPTVVRRLRGAEQHEAGHVPHSTAAAPHAADPRVTAAARRGTQRSQERGQDAARAGWDWGCKEAAAERCA